jgi:uncharacterized protein YndB with AHSA1/START domain
LKHLLFGALFGLAGLLAQAAPAGAAELPKHTLQRSITIAAPPAKVWAIIQNFGDLTWFSAVKTSNADKGNTPGSVRHLDLGGPVLIEQLEKYNASKMTYTYRITDDPGNVKVVPVSHYRSTITVKPAKGGGSTVVWVGHFSRGSADASPPAGMDDAAAIKAVTGIYEGALADLKKKAESQ